ncbi:MAG TPA: LLM class flavin-dependent oxidoreductase [Acidimicrobiales bacterium]|nr:LLM class flavin-dependent oxidoreductase [Acidimicrobiales bacterium]
MRLGVVILPEHRWPAAHLLWQRAEELGFEHAWTYDHLAWRTLRDEPWFAAVPTLAAAALCTTRIRLGTLVASPNFRHPVPFAKEVMTLDDLSGGRFVLGIGAGGPGWDATMLGQEAMSLSARADRFEEFVELCDQLLRQPATSYRGRVFAADEARSVPGCVQTPRVPFAVAATASRGMRVAALHGQWWVTTGDPRARTPPTAEEGARVVARQMDELEAACAATGRDPQSIGRMVLTGPSLDQGLSSAEALRDTIGRYAEIGVTDVVVHWPRPDGPYAGDRDRFEAVVSAVLAG